MSAHPSSAESRAKCLAASDSSSDSSACPTSRHLGHHDPSVPVHRMQARVATRHLVLALGHEALPPPPPVEQRVRALPVGALLAPAPPSPTNRPANRGGWPKPPRGWWRT